MSKQVKDKMIQEERAGDAFYASTWFGCNHRVVSNMHGVAYSECFLHGDVERSLEQYAKGKGCPHCAAKELPTMYDGYLDEVKMGVVLSEIFPNADIQRQYCFDEDGLRALKYDYYIPEHNLLVEFDGHFHYTLPSPTDTAKTNNAVIRGVSLVRIPYFIQMTAEAVHHYFADYDYDRSALGFAGIEPRYAAPLFPHGFMSDSVTLPSQFCARGLDRLMAEVNAMPYKINTDVLLSLYAHVKRVRSYITEDRESYVCPPDVLYAMDSFSMCKLDGCTETLRRMTVTCEDYS